MTEAGREGERARGEEPGLGIHTVGAAMIAAVARLRAAGFSPAAAKKEADELYAAIVCGPVSRAWQDRNEPLAPAVESRLDLALVRRAGGMPQAYAAGRANFRGHWLTVDRRVLIPRPETEGLVQLVIDTVGKWVRLPTVADIGTGSGAIAIALALEARIAGVIGTDISSDALNVALDNAAAAGAKDRVAFRRGALCAPLLDDTVDVIVSNPPYVATREWEQLDRGVRDYEPRVALDGGADGLAVIRGLLAEAPARLSPGGMLALEIDAGRAELTARMAQDAGFERVEMRNDLFGRARYVTARLPNGHRGN